jgi:hypothetical protein
MHARQWRAGSILGGIHDHKREQHRVGIVTSCDLTMPTVDNDLAALLKNSPTKVKGIRWILDCVGTFEGGKRQPMRQPHGMMALTI